MEDNAQKQNEEKKLQSQQQQQHEHQALSKNAQKKLAKQQRYEAKKAEKKALMKEQKKKEAERKRHEWEQTLASLPEEERAKVIDARKALRKERMDKRSEERELKIQRLTRAKEQGQNIVIDLEFSHLMASNELHSLVQQVILRHSTFSHSFFNLSSNFNFTSHPQLNHLPVITSSISILCFYPKEKKKNQLSA